MNLFGDDDVGKLPVIPERRPVEVNPDQVSLFDLINAVAASEYFDPTTATSCEISPYHVRARFTDECVADVFEVIFGALNTGNHDRSDPTTDYFDVGHYITLRIGAWNRPFVLTA